MSLAKPTNVLIDETLAELANRTGMNASAPESVTRALVEGPVTRLSELWSNFTDRELQMQLSTASGQGLDQLGQLVGVGRLSQSIGASSTYGMKFYLDAPAATPVMITAGTLVWDPTSPQQLFQTIFVTTIAAGEKETFVSVQARYAGSYYLANAGQLVASNGPSGVKCVNLEGIAGSSTEGDDSYRYRIGEALRARNVVSPDAIRAKLLEYPGIIDVQLLPYRRGVGTLDIVVFTAVTKPSQTLLDSVRDYAAQLVAYGVTVKVYAPVYHTVDLTVRVAFAPSTTIDDRATFRSLASAAITQYINAMTLGSSVYMDRVEYEVLGISEKIVDVSIVSMAIDGTGQAPGTITVDTHECVLAGRIEVA